MQFYPGGGQLLQAQKKQQLSSPVAVGDNGHLHPWSHSPARITAGEVKVLKSNLKSEEIINFYFVFL